MRRGPGRRFLVRLLPSPIVVILATATLRYLAERAGHYGLETGLAILVGAMVLMVTGLVTWSATALDREEARR